MKNRIKLIILALAASLGLSNCMDVQQVIKVKKDGSGTIEETMLISLPPELAAMAGDQDPLGDLLKGNAQKDRAKEMGEGVEHVSSKKFEGKDGAKGLKTIFKFSDINKVKLNGDAGMSAMNPDPNAKNAKKDDEQVVKFKFEKGSTAKLTIKTPPMDGVDGADEDIDPQQFAMMSQFMKGMRIRVSVEPDGKITKTNGDLQRLEKRHSRRFGNGQAPQRPREIQRIHRSWQRERPQEGSRQNEGTGAQGRVQGRDHSRVQVDGPEFA